MDADSDKTKTCSFLDLVDICDNFRLSSTGGFASETLVPWTLSALPDSPVLGLLRPIIIEQLQAENALSRSNHTPEAWLFHPTPSTARVSFADWVDTPSKRTAVLKELCERWRDSGLFPEVIGPRKWREESYPVYRDPFGVHRPHDARAEGGESGDPESEGGNYVLDLERSACALFGVVTYGVHMTIYQEAGRGSRELGGGGTMVWVPTRARTKQTWGGYLDNSVAGGIPSGMPIFESLVKESMEEASIAEDIVRGYAKSVGAVSYFFRTANGWLQPEVEFVYDLGIPRDVDPTPFQPKPLDGEVECFELLPLDEVVGRMRRKLFKPNCALVLIDFMIRHGYITPDNEPRYMEIATRLHGSFEYDRWGT
ncbi:hypothetical protein SERLA73DRAFT_167310 [Serpula lacrymans var. lacrymans S7.3]|uniref:Nudix hydrolase domain-containing protein n=2 Tax=Serpula lacrymans var. lacrymans TaxID=341189 RepID=F8PRU3_SERL3|nr:uncharacterized protein SERLADRAFT_447945 [Serpula lacrymans var. lacrymans S7.9]EGO01178.1 hypothetical protein SERLA73DRAFT_167310 [Serpula lacrymans var. lacrymans S7.3]EGO26827.1 hypothetical protein SERLADRAFT_447945 [Serpula lacrymans var. lacrymans S7.9]